MAEVPSLRLPAPAKLNLFLQITGRRADGYHLLQTVFQLIDLCDWVELAPRDDGLIERIEGPSGVSAETDLSVRAARLLRAHCGRAQGVSIAVDKRIPMGAGLGGGSSDAATVLHGLNRMWRCGLSADALAELGLALGADVPVFVRGHSAWADGVGEALQPLSLGPSYCVVLDSGVSVPTAELFQAPELTRDAAPMTIAGFVSGRARGNAFEAVLSARQPAVAAALTALAAVSANALQYGLSGTGGCCYARFSRREQAEAAQEALAPRWRCWLVEGLDRSPLLDALTVEPERD
jgi:4-diphosphocytidyl-2-C-methyl-D-erythritol kinase